MLEKITRQVDCFEPKLFQVVLRKVFFLINLFLWGTIEKSCLSRALCFDLPLAGIGVINDLEGLRFGRAERA